MRWGGRNGRSTAVAAAASGGATTAPSAIAAAHGIAGMSVRATTATAAVVNPTAKTTKPVTGAQLSLRSLERRVVSRIEQHGRDEERQRELGRDAERGRAWKKRQQRTAERQEYRIRCSDAARRGRQDHGRDEQTKKLFEFPHMTRCCRFKVRRAVPTSARFTVFPYQRLFWSALPCAAPPCSS